MSNSRPETQARSRFLGCLLGGAVGDALGAPIEFMTLDEIRSGFGPSGVGGMVAGAWPAGSITDDTQMTLFTAEGLLRADVRGRLSGSRDVSSCVGNAYARWMHTQGEPVGLTSAARLSGGFHLDGWLVTEPQLFARRAPGATCLGAMRADRFGTVEAPLNDSKGCGGVMRAAPAGLIPRDAGSAFRCGVEIAAITHGHPSGHLTAGCLGLIVDRLRHGEDLRTAGELALARVQLEPAHQEVSEALTGACERAGAMCASAERVESLGAGWVAEEALAIAIYSVLATRSFHDAVLLAVNHGGDSDSTGAIAGNLAGTLYGVEAIPSEWLDQLELVQAISRIADDLYRSSQGPPAWDAESESDVYPGW